MKRLDLFFIGLIIIVTIVAWHGILGQTIEGEGYYYFSPQNSLIVNGHLSDLGHGIDNFVKIATYIQESVFKGNIDPYMWVEFILIILVNLGFYTFLRIITKSPSIAFLGSIYESVYYTGNFQFYARGHYHWFYQRVPEVFPVFVSLIFLARFLNHKKNRDYLLSILFFSLALFFSHYTTFFLPFYIALIAVFSIMKLEGLVNKAKFISLVIPFIIINYFVTKDASLNLSVIHPHQTLLQSFLELKDLPQKVSYQLVTVTIPFPITQILSKVTNQNYPELIFSLIIPVYILYLIIFSNLYKTRSPHFILTVASFIALHGAFFLTVYFNRIKIYNEVEQSRYYFIPAFYVGFIFSVFINNLFVKDKKKIIFIVLLAIVWSTLNTKLIWKKIKDSQIYYDRNRAMYNLLAQTKDNFPENSIIFVPTSPGSMDFLNKYYSVNNIKYIYLDTNWQSHIPQGINIDSVFVFEFTEKKKVIDKSNVYRERLK